MSPRNRGVANQTRIVIEGASVGYLQYKVRGNLTPEFRHGTLVHTPLEVHGHEDWDAKLMEVFKQFAYVPGKFKGMPVHSKHRFRAKFRQK